MVQLSVTNWMFGSIGGGKEAPFRQGNQLAERGRQGAHLSHLDRPILDRKSGYTAESLVVADEHGTE
jgi:hypothetical protein